ncbi:hypothetical protein EUGRSUZ_B00183 [Eucalyptus grandis]|uniref:Uncharacterized protein n=2 Tax=Eucalyptus grandis TaxID=71139 RepID=A0A059CYC6_EUCGR|nr:hypothetical protein EUGRSUZ_B00183 [Eucalyptus grandis]
MALVVYFCRVKSKHVKKQGCRMRRRWAKSKHVKKQGCRGRRRRIGQAMKSQQFWLKTKVVSRQSELWRK